MRGTSFAVVLGLWVTGCGSSVGSLDGGSPQPAGAGDLDGGPPASRADAGALGPFHNGYVYVTQYLDSFDGGAFWDVSARFVETSFTDGSFGCFESTRAGCRATACGLGAGTRDGGTWAERSAGAVTVSSTHGGIVIDRPVVLVPYYPGGYYPASGAGYRYSPFDLIEVSATGEDVRAFGPVTGSMPEGVVVDPGLCPGGRCAQISLAQPFTVRWTPVSEGTVGVYLWTNVAGRRRSIGCSARSSAGRLTVPAAALAFLEPSDGGSGLVSVENFVGFGPVTVGVWTVELGASQMSLAESVEFTP